MRTEPYEATWQQVKASVHDQEVTAGKWKEKYTEDDFETVTGTRYKLLEVETLPEAEGIWFLCPLCFCTDRDTAHLVSVGFAGRAPPGTFSRGDDGKDTRWQIAGGTGIHDLRLAPSIWLKSEGGCGWHGFVGHAGVPAGEAR